MEKHIVAVTGVLKNQNNEVLIIKRNSKEIAYPGKWSLPGGKVERGETLIETLKREFLEEVGIEIESSFKYLHDYTFIRPDGHNVIGFNFLVTCSNDEVTLSNEFDGFKWIKPDQVHDFDHVPGIENSISLAFTK